MKKRPTLDFNAKKAVLKRMADDLARTQNYDSEEVYTILSEEFLEDTVIWELSQQELVEEVKRVASETTPEIASILSSLWLYKRETLDSLVHEWVIEENIVPTLAIGDKVAVKYEGRNYVGEIVDFIGKNAQYIVFIEELGHTKEGDGVRGAVVNYENAEKVDESLGTKN